MIIILANLIFGLLGALLVNYLADVLPAHRKIVPAYCHDCNSQKSLRYLLPFVPCQECGARATGRHQAVLILGPVLAGLLYYFPIESLGNFGAILWLVYFGLVVVIDLEHRLILHPVSLVGALIGFIFGSLSHGVVATIIGGAAGFGIMLIFYFLGELFVRYLSKSRGQEIDEVALGFGDVNLAGVIGLLLGWPVILLGIFFAIILGGIISGLFLLVQSIRKKYEAFQALPYGPFLVISVVIVYYYSQFVK
jgi:leader peptidase (prepilin peptidase)/N-methyltransferase